MRCVTAYPEFPVQLRHWLSAELECFAATVVVSTRSRACNPPRAALRHWQRVEWLERAPSESSVEHVRYFG
jgi:hypothetical protein